MRQAEMEEEKMAYNLYPNYEFEDERYTIMDVYMEYQRERASGDQLAEDFGQFLKWLDGYGIDSDGSRIPLWY